MTKTYLRPLGLVFGPDARKAIAAGQAASLGGMGHIGFTLVERIERSESGITRAIVPITGVVDHPLMAKITAARPKFGGLVLDRARIMGVVNVTPDSFSDGGKFHGVEAAVEHGRALAAQGADVLDIGGESTRPGALAVDPAEELARVLPVIAGLAGQGKVISLDTRKAAVMTAGLAAGAGIINDVSALSYDAEALAVVAKARAPVVLMHAQGDPRTMQLNPTYEDVVLDVYDYLESRVAVCLAAGIAAENICVDPGIGFGKNFKHNVQVMNGLSVFHGLGVGLLVGLSRKGFVGALTGVAKAADRAYGSIGGALHVAQNACHLVRVHDVKASIAAMAVFQTGNDPDLAEF
jgi:dihydropteroate synthase